MAVNPKGVMFINSMDTTGKVKDHVYVADSIAQAVNSVGPHNVVQVVTDGAANCVGAGELLQER